MNNSVCQFTHAYTTNRTEIPIFLLSNKTNKKNRTRSVIFSIAAAGSLEGPNRVSVRGCEIVDSSTTNENLRPMRCGQEDIYIESTCIVQPKTNQFNTFRQYPNCINIFSHFGLIASNSTKLDTN